MRAHRLSLRLLLPAGLILLVVLLGALQYRWLGQVSEAERAQLQRSLGQRADEFGAEFDREISLAYELLTIDGSTLNTDPWPSLGERYDTWRQRAMLPEMVRALYIARSSNGGHTLARWSPETRSGAEVEWPAHFAAVQRALSLSTARSVPIPAAAPAGAMLRSTTAFSMSISPVVDAVPALVVPIMTHARPTETGLNVMVALKTAGTDFVVVELDREVLTQTLIPALVERHFPNEDANHYRVAIVDRAHDHIFDRGLGTPTDGVRRHVDAAATFFTGARFQLTTRVLTESRRSTTTLPSGGAVSVFVQEHSGTSPTAQAVRVALPGWQIMLQHGAGSLDEAVARARRRNLATSFGILGVLVIGVGLIVVNARRSETLAARQMEFVATVSHELRTPLAVIRSAAQNLSAGVVDDPAQARRYGVLIENEGRRLTDMVEEVLEFAGLSGNRRALALRPVDLTWLAQDIIAAQADSLAAQGITTDVTTAGEVPMVMADEDALRRALNNLIGNAAKYAADGHWIGIAISRHESDGQEQVWVAVSDRGPGIATEDLPHLFEPFYRGREVVARQIHGNGLGLSLVSRIAEAHHGTVEVSSTPASGSTFTLKLPAASSIAPADIV